MDGSSNTTGAIAELIGRAFEQAPNGLLLVSTQGVVIAANRAAINLFDDRSSSVVGCAMTDVIATIGGPHDVAWLARSLAEASDAQGSAPAIENVIDERDRERTTVWTVRPITSPDGEVRSLIVEARDITGIPQADTEARAEAQLAGTVSIATDAIISIDGARRISLFNWGAERMFGYPADEALGQSLDMLLPEELRKRHAGEIARFGESSQTARRMGERSTIVGQRKNGEIFPAEASISRYMAGGQWTFTVIMRDITDRRRTEDGLRFLAEVGALLADLLQDQMALQRAAERAVPTLGDTCVIDLVENDHVVTAAVAAREPALARALQEFRDRVPPAWGLPTPAIDAMQNRQTLVLPDGIGDGALGRRWADSYQRGVDALKLGSLLVVPLVAHDHVLGSLSFAMTSGGRRHDDSYRVLAEEFAMRIASAVDNATLYQRTRQAVGARDETLAVVSHDLRNPLSAITMCVTALRETPSPSAETTTELLGSIHESTELMSRIIQDLLDVASIDAGRLSLERQRQTLGPLFERVAGMFHGAATEREITLVIDHAGLRALPEIDVDGERMVQVLGNLLHNALKFTDAGGIVRLSATATGGKVIVEVSDTGAGIAPEDLPHIFDRFWHGRRRAKMRSTGLGLAISRGIVQAHGGRIRAESTLGHGTAVFFDILVAAPKGR